jgi:hypothetical protein
MDEKIFYEQGKIKVTSARFVANSETLPMSNVASVRIQKMYSFRQLFIAGFFGVGLFCLLMALFGYMVLFWILAGVVFALVKPTYGLYIETTSGSKQMLISKDTDYLDSILSHLNDAIIHRG